MKKFLALILALIMVFALFAACSKKNSESTNKLSDAPSSSSSDNSPVNTTSPDIDNTQSNTVSITEGETKVFPSDDATFKVASNTNLDFLTQAGNPNSPAGFGSLFFGEALISWDSSTNEVIPGLAEKWEWIDDLTLRLYLRKDVTSIIGDPFTANDVIYTFKWDSEAKSLGQYFSIFDYDKTKAVDDYTLDLVLKKSFPYLPLDLCMNVYNISVEASVEKLGGREAVQLNPNCQTGPYKMTKFDAVSQVCYAERRDDYYGTLPYYKYLEIYAVTDANTRAMGIESGDYNFAINPASASVVSADGKSSKGWYVPAAGRYYYVGMNSNRENMNIKEFRQAIALAINYEACLNVSNAGQGVLSDCAIGSSLNPYSYTPASDPDKCYSGRTDIELAKQKLTESGVTSGVQIEMIYASNDAQSLNNAEVIKNNLGQIGIDCVLVPCESAAFTATAYSGEWDLRLSVTGNTNPKKNLNMIDGRRQPMDTVTGCCGENWYPDFDKIEALLDSCIETVDDEKRMAAFTELNDICREYVPMVVLYCPYVTFLSSADIVNVPVDVRGAANVNHIYPAEYLEG